MDFTDHEAMKAEEIRYKNFLENCKMTVNVLENSCQAVTEECLTALQNI